MYYILRQKLLHFALPTLLHFALLLHFVAKVITFCVTITFCVSYYILWRNRNYCFVLFCFFCKNQNLISYFLYFQKGRARKITNDWPLLAGDWNRYHRLTCICNHRLTCNHRLSCNHRHSCNHLLTSNHRLSCNIGRL